MAQGALTEAVGGRVCHGAATRGPGSPGAGSRFHQRLSAPWVVVVARLRRGERLVSLSSPGCGLRVAGHWVMVCSLFLGIRHGDGS